VLDLDLSGRLKAAFFDQMYDGHELRLPDPAATVIDSPVAVTSRDAAVSPLAAVGDRGELRRHLA